VPFDIGINFRSTSGYVADGANETYCLADIYPVTRGGVTFGWVITGAVDSRDRDSGNDRRLAGINFTTNNADYFRLDLPAAGTYDVHLAMGDATFSGAVSYDVKDTTTLLFSTTGSTSAGNKFKDATDTEYSNAAWPGSEAASTQTFATTQLRVQHTGGGVNDVIAHLRVAAAGGGISPIGKLLELPNQAVKSASFY
jgi:hypothetical protein